MSLVDRTNEEIPLSLAGITLGLDVDQDSSFDPPTWVWLGLSDPDDSDSRWYKITHAEVALIHDRLGRILGSGHTSQIMDRVIEAEAERDHYRLQTAEAKAALSYCADRLDEFTYGELASAIDDEWCDEETGARTASHALERVKAEAWDEGVAIALNHAIRDPDKITLRLEHLDGQPWVNPYRTEASA